MITIIVDTKDEYDVAMRDFASGYVCRYVTYKDCQKQLCQNCYKDNHLKVGINVIYSVDNNHPD